MKRFNPIIVFIWTWSTLFSKVNPQLPVITRCDDPLLGDVLIGDQQCALACGSWPSAMCNDIGICICQSQQCPGMGTLDDLLCPATDMAIPPGFPAQCTANCIEQCPSGGVGTVCLARSIDIHLTAHICACECPNAACLATMPPSSTTQKNTLPGLIGVGIGSAAVVQTVAGGFKLPKAVLLFPAKFLKNPISFLFLKNFVLVILILVAFIVCIGFEAVCYFGEGQLGQVENLLCNLDSLFLPNSTVRNLLL